jgi:hypothetical protein
LRGRRAIVERAEVGPDDALRLDDVAQHRRRRVRINVLHPKDVVRQAQTARVVRPLRRAGDHLENVVVRADCFSRPRATLSHNQIAVDHGRRR